MEVQPKYEAEKPVNNSNIANSIFQFHFTNCTHHHRHKKKKEKKTTFSSNNNNAVGPRHQPKKKGTTYFNCVSQSCQE